MKFHIISEGSTDFRVLKTIIKSIFPDTEVHSLVPVLDVCTLKTIGHAGWEKVVEYLTSNFLEDSLVNTDYLVIQIDTDICEHTNFGVSPITLADNDQEVFYELIQQKIIEWIDTYEPETYDHYKEKFIFAICIHSLECWLIAYYCPNHELRHKRTKNGFNHLQRALSRSGIALNEPKDPAVYEKISSPLKKRRDLLLGREYSYSLNKFIFQLEQIESNLA